MQPTVRQAFTRFYPRKAATIVTETRIGLPCFKGSGLTKDGYREIQAIWDTGATGTVVTRELAKQLDLFPAGRTTVLGVHGPKEVNEYFVGLVLPNGLEIDIVKVTEADMLADNCHALIGMDIIGKGDFAITNFNGVTVFSFRYPSMQVIDFTV